MIEFSVSFYEALGYGKTVETAFKVALASLADGDAEALELFPPRDQDSDKKRHRVLVDPGSSGAVSG